METSRIEMSTLTKDQKALHTALTKEAVVVESKTRDVQGEAITKYCWKNTANFYLELGCIDRRIWATNVSLTITSVNKQRIFKLIGLAHEITGVNVAQKTWHKLLNDASTKEAVADDTANTSCVNQTTPRTWRELGGERGRD